MVRFTLQTPAGVSGPLSAYALGIAYSDAIASGFTPVVTRVGTHAADDSFVPSGPTRNPGNAPLFDSENKAILPHTGRPEMHAPEAVADQRVTRDPVPLCRLSFRASKRPNMLVRILRYAPARWTRPALRARFLCLDSFRTVETSGLTLAAPFYSRELSR